MKHSSNPNLKICVLFGTPTQPNWYPKLRGQNNQPSFKAIFISFFLFMLYKIIYLSAIHMFVHLFAFATRIHVTEMNSNKIYHVSSSSNLTLFQYK